MHAFKPTRDAVDGFALIDYSGIGARVDDVAKFEDFVIKLGASIDGELVDFLKSLRLLDGSSS